MTGWGQDGPLAQRAGHDIALHRAHRHPRHDRPARRAPRRPGQPRRRLRRRLALSGRSACSPRSSTRAPKAASGQVVDAAIVDGTAHLATMIHGMLAAGGWQDRPRREPARRRLPLLRHLRDRRRPVHGGRRAGAAVLRRVRRAARHRGPGPGPRRTSPAGASCAPPSPPASRPVRATSGRAVFEGSDACVAPVLSLREAPRHPHLAARGTFTDHGGITQPAPAPRFSATPAAVTRRPRPAGRRHRRGGPRLGPARTRARCR